MDRDDWDGLADLWAISLRSSNKAPLTITGYLTGVRQFTEWCGKEGRPLELSRHNAEAFVAHELDSGLSASTAAHRMTVLRLFSTWCCEVERAIPRDDLVGLKSPKLDQKIVEGLTRDEMLMLVKACEGRRFTDLRDMALVRFTHATGARADEVLSMRSIDVQVGARSAVITRGKGGKGRRVGFGDKTAEALLRYQRARRRHPQTERPEFWLAWHNGRHSNPNAVRGVLTYEGMRGSIERRAEAAGIEGFHLHRLRHTWAVAWAKKGGSTTGLMSAGGWVTIEMPMRYFGSAANDLAVEEAQRLALDDF